LDDALDLSNICQATAILHQRAGHLGLASTLAERRLKLWRHWDVKLPRNGFV